MNKQIDWIYISPAILCSVAFLAGFVPCYFCLSSPFFMQLSIAIFIVSLLLHVVILLLWKRYKNHSPLAYALTQPMAHSIILVIALSVGAVDRCAPEATRYSGGPLRDIPAIKNPGHFNQ